MFARLREHANNIENDIQAVERTLEFKLKSVFSVTETEPSESSRAFFESLITDLNDINANVIDLIQENRNLYHTSVAEYKKFRGFVEDMQQQLDKIEANLEACGYARNASETSPDVNSLNGDNQELIDDNENDDREMIDGLNMNGHLHND